MNTRSFFFIEAMMMIIPGRKDIHDLRVTAYQVLTKVAAGSAPPAGEIQRLPSLEPNVD